MNDTAEGLISFLSAHETLGMQGDWWAAESWPGAALFGRHSVFLGQSALSQIHLAVGRSLHTGPSDRSPALRLFLKAPDLHFLLWLSPLSIGPQNIHLTPLFNFNIF